LFEGGFKSSTIFLGVFEQAAKKQLSISKPHERRQVANCTGLYADDMKMPIFIPVGVLGEDQMRTVNGLQRESLSNNQEISFLGGSTGGGECRRFLNFCKQIIYKTLSSLEPTENRSINCYAQTTRQVAS